MISEFNRRITINRYVFAQDPGGGNIASPLASWMIWAKVETSSGSKTLDNAQVSYTKAFRIKIRTEKSRPLMNTDEIIYLGNNLIIQSITREDEGRENFLNIEAYTTNEGATEIIPPATGSTVYWGWSPTPFVAGNVEGFTYQEHADFVPTGNINADYTAASVGNYLVLKYPATFTQKDTWFNSMANQGYIPDQVFDATILIGDFRYVFTRLIPALEQNNKVIIYG
jgi:SPP1 family predicted phage head-tail adaptor